MCDINLPVTVTCPERAPARLSERAGALFAAGRPVAVDGGSGRVVRAAFSFPDRRVDGEAFARSPCGSQNGAESRELVIEIRHIWTRCITYGRDFDIYDRDSPFVIEIRQSLADIPRNM